MANFPLSPFRQIENTFYLSGQIGQVNGELVSEDVEAQVKQAIANIMAILSQNGMSIEHVVDVTAFLVEQQDYAAFNKAYAEGFKEPYPSRTTVTVKSLPLGAKVELKVIAEKN